MLGSLLAPHSHIASGEDKVKSREQAIASGSCRSRAATLLGIEHDRTLIALAGRLRTDNPVALYLKSGEDRHRPHICGNGPALKRRLFSAETASVCAMSPESETARLVKEMNLLSAHRSSNPAT